MAIQIYYGKQIHYWDSIGFYEKATPKDIANCLQAGADLNARLDTEESTPLHLAARHSEDSAVIAALLNAGASPNADNRYTLPCIVRPGTIETPLSSMSC